MAPYLGAHVTTIFRLMGIAEEEIARAKDEQPLMATQIDMTFCLLCPRMQIFGGRAPDLYRSHARELIQRAIDGEDTTLGTVAEVLCVLSETSLNAPLTRSAGVLMERLIEEVLPGTINQIYEDEWKDIEEWPGATDEIFAQTQRRCADETRTIEQKRRGA
jgi:hypothetical protein